MIYKYSTLRKGLRSCILLSLVGILLSGCTGPGQEIEEPETVSESTQTEEQEEAEKDGVEEIEGTEGIEETEEADEALVGSNNLNMPEIEVSRDSFSVKVKIKSEEEYQAFVDCLEEYTESVSLTLYLEETDTVIYLDDILEYQNFEFLKIYYGGTISARNMEILNENPLRKIELHHSYAIEENVLSKMPNLQYITIRIDSQYNGALPAKELLQNTDCENVVVIWDDEGKGEMNLKELTECDKINAALAENDCYLRGLYILNEDDYNYISYEFCNRGEERITCETKECKVFICIKDRESYGEKYFDILEVPIESIDALSWHEGRRMRLKDMNFDGYHDLIFLGYNASVGGGRCIGFLWNEKEQRYEWNATVPTYYDWVDAERERIECTYSMSAFDDDYRIYEYNGSVFTEKRLEVTLSRTESRVTWQYYEDGKLMKRLEKYHDEDTKLYYITYEENGIVTEDVMEEGDYDYKYDDYSDLGQEYFPEFDFYRAG